VKQTGVIVGTVLVLLGVLFGLQGLGVVGGSAMSGKTAWAIIGPIIAIVGVILVVASRRGASPR
jgi:hypothetical protein